MRKSPDDKIGLRASGPGLLLAALLGAAAYGLTRIWHTRVLNPLVLALAVGVALRTAVGHHTTLNSGFTAAPLLCIPIGITFYAVKNLNFAAYAEVHPTSMMLAALIVFVYFATILILGRLLGQPDRITYLTAAGSAICGASAIAITSPAVDADSNDISVSLLAVTTVAIVALFILLPFVATTVGMTDQTYGVLSGSVLQMTGCVKAAVMNLPFLSRQITDKDLVSLALSVKAARYLGLLIAIPLFASLTQKRFYLPWTLWLFLRAGLLGTWISVNHGDFYSATLIPTVKPLYGLSWSIAMTAIGLNADVRQLLSSNGAKALIMALGGCSTAIVTFFIGSMILG
ncbi:MAG: putative sulfate exporter family transporter [Phycisphaerales bacterium]|nr:MAG: putative sulfate exporter family transporter [Phycisphaerales bacterium]